MKKKYTIFLTGATGLVGSYLLKILLENGHRVYVLARPKRNKSSHQRIKELLDFWDVDVSDEDIMSNLKVVEGDITYSGNLGIKNTEIIDELRTDVEIVFHSAALTDLRAPWEVIKVVNIDGTKNVLDFVFNFRNIKKVNHISTTYVVGESNCLEFGEDMFELDQDFHNTYERSKFEAERLVRIYKDKGLNISIFRPSLITGRSIDGKTIDFRIFYEPLHFFSLEIYDEFPGDINCIQNLIHVDTVANILYVLGDREESDVYHLVSPEDITVGLFLSLASNFFGFRLPQLVPLEKFDFRRWTVTQRLLAEPFIPYFNYRTKIKADKTRKIINNDVSFPPFDKDNLRRIFNFCVERSFIKIKR